MAGKAKNAAYQTFPPIPTIFSKIFFLKVIKSMGESNTIVSVYTLYKHL